jgi:uncharacterized protein
MEHVSYGDSFFLRLDQGEEIIESLKVFASQYNNDFFAITSGVGMIEGLKFGFFCVNDNDYDVHTFSGVLDLSSISGNIARRDGVWWPHVHFVANYPNFSTLSGHVLKAKAHITMEIWLTGPQTTGIGRRTEPGRPVTFLSRNK